MEKQSLKIDLKKQIFWSAKQRNHLRRLIKQKAVIAYVCTDQHGRPSNGGPKTPEWQVYPGLVQKVSGPLLLCGPGALHGTFEPHRWAGSRVWVAGFCGEVQQEEDNLGSLHREIVGEVFPETAISASVLARLGCKELRGANLNGADMLGAYLSEANLNGANLSGANLRGALLCGASLRYANLGRSYLRNADLIGADLSGASLINANLRGANMYGVNLNAANLNEADLSRANMYKAKLYEACLNRANLRGVDLGEANLSRANLEEADLRKADLAGANLIAANLNGADLSGAYLGENLDIPGWTNKNGYLFPSDRINKCSE